MFNIQKAAKQLCVVLLYMKRLSDIDITIVEAVYLCMIKETLPLQLEDDLVEYIYKRDPYMYVYLVWLFQRWYVLYAIHKDHLPTRFKS